MLYTMWTTTIFFSFSVFFAVVRPGEDTIVGVDGPVVRLCLFIYLRPMLPLSVCYYLFVFGIFYCFWLCRIVFFRIFFFCDGQVADSFVIYYFPSRCPWPVSFFLYRVSLFDVADVMVGRGLPPVALSVNSTGGAPLIPVQGMCKGGCMDNAAVGAFLDDRGGVTYFFLFGSLGAIYPACYESVGVGTTGWDFDTSARSTDGSLSILGVPVEGSNSGVVALRTVTM